jgi:radical SAM protein with 4Fe4S-binding SPASM domain
VDDIVKDNPFRSIYISMQGIEKEAYEETMRGSLVFETTLANVEYLIEQRAKYLPKLEIVVTMVKTNRIDADRAVEYWKQRGVKSQYTILENRGGAIHDFEQIAAGRKRLFKNCTRLFKNAMITFDGDMVLCCVDYYRKVVLGNVKKNSIAEVWNSPRATEIRRKFLAGDLSDNPLCASCFVADD